MLPCLSADGLGRLAGLALSMPLTITAETNCMRNNSRTPLQKTAVDRALDQAVQRVYDAYGPDLTRFVADVQQQRAQEGREAREEREAESGTAGMRPTSDTSGS